MAAAKCLRMTPCPSKIWSAARSALALTLTQSLRPLILDCEERITLSVLHYGCSSANYPLWLWRGMLFILLLRRTTQSWHLTGLVAVSTVQPCYRFNVQVSRRLQVGSVHLGIA